MSMWGGEEGMGVVCGMPFHTTGFLGKKIDTHPKLPQLKLIQ
jgi:hypothetical protein